MRILVIFSLIFLLVSQLAYGKHTKVKKRPEKPFKSFVVVEEKSGKILMSENEKEKRIPASLTKLMLSLLVLEKLEAKEISLTDKVTVSKKAAQMGGSQVFLKEGEVFTVEELMKATLVASGNDAAYALAEKIAGSAENFVQLMNEKAQSLGMKDTIFRSVSGLPVSNSNDTDITTCVDMAILARNLLKYPKILEWTSIKKDTFREGKFLMVNHNKLLSKMDGIVDGLKTGYLKSSGYNIVTTAKKDNFRVILVVMGSPSCRSRDDFVIDLINRVYSEWKLKDIVKKGEVVNKDIILPDGKFRKIKGVVAQTFFYPIRKNNPGIAEKEIRLPEKLSGEVKEGQKLGEILIKMDGEPIGNVDIVSPVYVPKANLFTRIIRRVGLNI
ncbi:MAG: D-alanyl-D-alanine carboxypeptidase [Deltaproteobacteria bacterium]|nr:D-alanyl-D-alanine carboxypeptidase [Deltaproteobacteria bacterium]